MSARFAPVFLTRDEVSLLKKRIAGEPWAQDIANKALFEPARRDDQRAIHIPPPFWAEYASFHDPQTGAPLSFDPDKRGAYSTPDGRELRSPELDWGWDAICHDQNANAMRRWAMAGMLQEDAGLLGKARELLTEYANGYGTYPPRGRQSATWGKLYYQALNESVWAISALWATECLWHADALSEKELTGLRDQLFFPLADLVWGEWYFIHNIRKWHNAAIGCIGLAFGERSLVRHAIFGDKGFRQQLVDGYRWKDGFSCEGTVGYHGYGMAAMVFLSEAMHRHGFDPYHDPHLRRALLAPFELAQPDGTPPTLGDMFRSRALPTRLYATALGRYPDDPPMRAAASVAFRQWEAAGCVADFESSAWNNSTAYFGRSEVDWILHGPPPDEAECQSPGKSVIFPDTGMAIARPEPGSYLLVKTFAKTGNHDHFDRLGIVWWEDGRCWLDDPGTCYYSHPNHEGWFKHTIAHNTACIDGKKQERGTGRILHATEFRINAEAHPYPSLGSQVRFHRSLERQPGGWRDTFQSCGHAHSVLLFYHPRGEWVNRPAQGQPATIEMEGLSPGLPQGLRSIPVSDLESPLIFRQGEALLEITPVDMPEDAILLTGGAPGDPQNQGKMVPFLAFSSHRPNAVFTTNLQTKHP